MAKIILTLTLTASLTVASESQAAPPVGTYTDTDGQKYTFAGHSEGSHTDAIAPQYRYNPDTPQIR